MRIAVIFVALAFFVLPVFPSACPPLLASVQQVSDEDLLKLVQNRYLDFDLSTTLVKAFNGNIFLKDPRWDVLETRQGRRFVIAYAAIDGDALYSRSNLLGEFENDIVGKDSYNFGTFIVDKIASQRVGVILEYLYIPPAGDIENRFHGIVDKDGNYILRSQNILRDFIYFEENFDQLFIDYYAEEYEAFLQKKELELYHYLQENIEPDNWGIVSEDFLIASFNGESANPYGSNTLHFTAEDGKNLMLVDFGLLSLLNNCIDQKLYIGTGILQYSYSEYNYFIDTDFLSSIFVEVTYLGQEYDDTEVSGRDSAEWYVFDFSGQRVVAQVDDTVYKFSETNIDQHFFVQLMAEQQINTDSGQVETNYYVRWVYIEPSNEEDPDNVTSQGKPDVISEPAPEPQAPTDTGVNNLHDILDAWLSNSQPHSENLSYPQQSNAAARALADLQDDKIRFENTNSGVYDSYAALVILAIQPYWSAQSFLRENLTVQIRIIVNEDGLILSSRIERSSGNPAYDASALNSIERTRILPRPPSGSQYEIVINFNSLQMSG